MGWYKIHTDVKNWSDAKEVCIREGANLLVINSRQEAKAMVSLMEKTGTTGKFHWIGFHDVYEEGNYITIFSKCSNVTGICMCRTSTVQLIPLTEILSGSATLA